MKRKYIYIGLILIAIIFVILAIFFCGQDKNKTVTTSNGEVLSNKKIGWGIKRTENHAQPDLGSANKKLIDENNDIAMGNKEDKYVYLTFDEGYEAGYTPSILETLKNNNVKAAFFITGHYLNSSENLVKQMIDEGHIVRKSHGKPLLYARFRK